MPYYMGQKIALQSSRRGDGRWVCAYGIIQATPELLEANKGHVTGTYSTREEAEAAGLRKAKRLIDSRELLPRLSCPPPAQSRCLSAEKPSEYGHGDRPKKIQIIRECLEKLFPHVTIGGEYLTLFEFNHDSQRQQLKIDQDFLDDVYPLEKLRPFIVKTVIPELLANPDRRIDIGRHGALTITRQIASPQNQLS